MFLDNSTRFNVIERSLDATSLRQRVIADNIANDETPYFKRSDVVFEEVLKQNLSGSSQKLAGKRTNPKHFIFGQTGSLPEPEIIQDKKSVMNTNQNNVDMDYEMALSAMNQSKYNALIQQMNHELTQMRIVIDGGK